jgi:tetratricopeptide (TPR) repeat protein
MDLRKWAVMLGVAVSCAGCVTETKDLSLSPEAMASKGAKEAPATKRQAHSDTWVAVGRLHESKAEAANDAPVEQNLCRDEARKAYQKAIELDPHCLEAHVALANLYLRQEDPDRAIAVYLKAVQQNPKAAVLWYEEGMVHCCRKDFDKALQCLGKAHELDPDNRPFATQYGLCLARAGRAHDAVMVLGRVMNRAEAHYNVARMMQHIGQGELARQYVQFALQERPTHSGALMLLAQLNGSSGTLAPAVADSAFDPDFRPASLQGPE